MCNSTAIVFYRQSVTREMGSLALEQLENM